MTKYYSATTGGFYSPDIHGARTVMVPDPHWHAPEGEPEQEAPLIEEVNPFCRIPSDAVEISEEKWLALLSQQEGGKIISANEEGHPEAQTPPAHIATLEQVRARRNQLLNETGWTQSADERDLMTPDQAAAWDAYRQAVRAAFQSFQPGAEVNWPTAPQTNN